MAIPPYLFYILATILVIGVSIGLFSLGLKLKNPKHRFLVKTCNVISFIVLFVGALAAYVALDERTSSDLFPTLITLKQDGKLETRKIITPYYKGIPVHFRFRGGFYIVENETKETIQIVKAFYHFYGNTHPHNEAPQIICELAPYETSVVESKPVAIVPELPSRRYFKVSRAGNPGDGRSATYILYKND